MKKRTKISFLVISLALVFSVIFLGFSDAKPFVNAESVNYESIDTETPNGDGKSANTAYEISNIKNLKWLDDLTLNNETEGIYFKLICDIDLSSVVNFRPIGQNLIENIPFKGNFDGNNYEISNLTYMNAKSNMPDGFFGAIENATIENLTLKNFVIGNQNNSVSNVGIFVGEMKGNSILKYCTAESDIDPESEDVFIGRIKANAKAGGFVGYMTGGIIDCCRSNISINSNSKAGGLVGEAEIKINETQNNIEIKNSYSIGNIERSIGATGGNFGGLVGNIVNSDSMPYRVAVSNSYFGGIMNANSDTVGALLGCNKHNLATFSNCCYYSNVFVGSAVRVGYPEESGDNQIACLQGNEMRNIDCFDGFDFSNLWVINENIDENAIAIFGKYPDFAKYYDTVKVSAKLNGQKSTKYCNIYFDRLKIKGENLHVKFMPMDGARLGEVLINNINVTDKFYIENEKNGSYIKQDGKYIPYVSSIHGDNVTRYNAVNEFVFENLQENIDINYSFIEKTVRLTVNENKNNTVNLISVNGKEVPTNFSFEAIPYNSELVFQVNAPVNFELDNIEKVIDGVATVIKLNSKNQFTLLMDNDVDIKLFWEKIRIPFDFSKIIDINTYRDADFGSIKVLINNYEPQFDEKNNIILCAGDKVEIIAHASDGFEFLGWQISGEDNLIVNDNYTIASVFENLTELKIVANFTKIWNVNINFEDNNSGDLFINGQKIENGITEFVFYHGKENDFEFLINSDASNYIGVLKIGNEIISNNFTITNDAENILAKIQLKEMELKLNVGANTLVEFSDKFDGEYKIAKKELNGEIVIKRPIGSEIYLLVTPNSGEFSKWTNENCIEYKMDENEKIINSNGIVVKNKFKYNFSNSRYLFYNTESVFSISVTTNNDSGVLVYIDSINGKSLYDDFDGNNIPINPYKTNHIKLGDVVTIKIILEDEFILNTDNLDKSALQKIGNVYKYVIKNIENNKSINFNVERKTYEVNVASQDFSIGQIEIPKGPFYKGTIIKLNTSFNKGYKFIGYEINNKLITNVSPINYEYEITGEYDVINIMAKFEKVENIKNYYNVKITEPNIIGYNYQKSGSGTYLENSNVTVDFSSDYLDFIGWYEGDTERSTNKKYNFTCTRDIVLTPKVYVKTFKVTKNNLDKYISILPQRENNTYKIGEKITLVYSALGLQGNDFKYWTNGGFKIDGNSGNSKFVLFVTQNMDIDAVVTPKSNINPNPTENYYKLTCVPNDIKMGNTSSTNGTQFIENGMTTIKAKPYQGYEFLYWELDGVNVSYEPDYLVTDINGDLHYTAVFQVKKLDILYSSNNSEGGTYSGVTKAPSGSNQQIEIKAKQGFRIKSILVNGVAIPFNNDKNTIINLSDINTPQNIYINYRKSGLSSYELIILLGAGGLIFFMLIGIIVALNVKPNKKKLNRLVEARSVAVATLDANGIPYDKKAMKQNEKKNKKANKHLSKIEAKENKNALRAEKKKAGKVSKMEKSKKEKKSKPKKDKKSKK